MLSLLASFSLNSQAKESVGCHVTDWTYFGSNHQICLIPVKDPDIPEITCYVTENKKGKITSELSHRETYQLLYRLESIRCKQTSPIKKSSVIIPKPDVFSKYDSKFFLWAKTDRLYDRENNSLIYISISRTLVGGESLLLDISIIPLNAK